ncbi:HEPN domain-containing protein [Candidatus Poribacteria bacterium]|nr:HEPN domain-containing protein [Candidatus Poribacteria bacterium]
MNLERKTVLLQVANERLKDATILLKQTRYNGAVYWGGYVIECLLKAAICVYLNRDNLPATYRIHELSDLLYYAGLLAFRRVEQSVSARFADLAAWNVSIRYYGRRFDVQEAREFLDAVKEVRIWILRKISP